MRTISASALDLAGLIRPGDRVVCAQAGAEPLTLTRRLVAQRAALGDGVRVFLGAMFAPTFQPAHADHLRFESYGAMGTTVPLAQAGYLSVMPCHYSEIDEAFERGSWPADVVLLQLAPGLDDGPPSLGLGNDYAAAAARRARVVIAEINPDAPWTYGAQCPPDLRIDLQVAADTAPVPIAPSAFDAREEQIAAYVAELVPDRATIQTGIGSLPDAVLHGLAGHRDLGLHSGLIGDGAMALIQAGAVSNACKAIDPGITVTNVVCGTPQLHRFLHRNPAVSVRPGAYTHGPQTLAQLADLYAINSALEIDLSGQVNAETLGRALRGGVGGANDFARAARRAAHGRSITVMPATAQGGARSRIVPTLSGGVVTISRSDVDLVVTEHGVADLRHCTLEARAQRLIAIAEPRFRDALQRALTDPDSWKDTP